MDKKDVLIKESLNKLSNILRNFLAYKKVDATLTEETLSLVLAYLDKADISLERGFVKDACDEIEEQMVN